MKSLAKKYRGHGFHIWCNQCAKVVTSSPCSHHQYHRYQSRIWNKATQRTDIIVTWHTTDLREAFNLHMQKKRQVKSGIIPTKLNTALPSTPDTLKQAINVYYETLKDIDVPEHKRKGYSEAHIKAEGRNLMRFYSVIDDPALCVDQVNESHVGAFHQLLHDLGFKARTYNAHMITVKKFFSWAIEKGATRVNPISGIKWAYVVGNTQILTDPELKEFFDLITAENGHCRKERKNYYRSWLAHAYKLALLTGERRDGIFLMKWSHIDENYIRIPNYKINRIKKVDKYRYCPISRDLAELLLDIKPGNPDDYIIAPDQVDRNFLKQHISKAFTHYWRQHSSKKKISFRHLRKTYLTRVKIILGEKTKGLEIHSNESTTFDHYIDRKEITKELLDKSLFDV